ncbi:MAG: gliding motility-associated transport system permease protein [Clostridiales bacterium]|nr:gliding motility-associated transport system permease protein [Clostridiales bacterium]
MNRVMAICKRDYLTYFRSPMGYVIMAIFMALSGLFFSSFLLNGSIDLAGEMAFMQSFFFVLIPLMTMRSFAEDRKNGTEVLLYTSPATTMEIVLGKYFASFFLFLTMTATTLVHVFITLLYNGVVDVRVLGAYIAFVFLGAAYLAIGVFASAMTENQIIAAVISFITIMLLTLIDAVAGVLGSVVSTLLGKINFFGLTGTQISSAGEAVTNAVRWINPSARISDFSAGIFEISPLLFFVSVSAVFLFMTNRVIEKRRWSQR